VAAGFVIRRKNENLGLPPAGLNSAYFLAVTETRNHGDDQQLPAPSTISKPRTS
jgi:hypothetical protein